MSDDIVTYRTIVAAKGELRLSAVDATDLLDELEQLRWLRKYVGEKIALVGVRRGRWML